MTFSPAEPQQLLIDHLLSPGTGKLGFVGVGIGKTSSTLSAIDHLMKRGECKGVLVMAPMRVANLTWPMEVEKWSDFKWMKVANLRTQAGKRAFMLGKAQIYTCNFEGIPNLLKLVKARHDLGQGLPYDTLVIDECFAAGTLVDTVEGKKPIEQLKEGDCVRNAVGVGFVTHVHTNTPTRIVHLRINGESIWCSASHLFFTGRGWVAAEALTGGDSVIRQDEAVRILREALPSEDSQQRSEDPILRKGVLLQSATKTGGETTASADPVQALSEAFYSSQVKEIFLRHVLLCEVESSCGSSGSMDSGAKSQDISKAHRFLCFGVGDGKETARSNYQFEAYAESDFSGQVECFAEGDGAQTEGTGRKWQALIRGSECLVGIPEEGGTGALASRIHILDTGDTFRQSASLSLQAGYCLRGSKAEYRSGRPLPHGHVCSEKGYQENRSLEASRVDNIEVYESTDPRLDFLRSPDGVIRFYDLSVSGHPSYSVNGMLVHNCTKIKNPSAKRPKAYRAQVPHKLHTRIWALTGTPAPNSLLDLFAQVRFVDNGQHLGPSYELFKQAYFKESGYNGYKLVPLPNAEEDIYKRIAPITLTLRSSEWLDIPETVVEDIEVPLSKPLAQEYKDFEKELVLEIKGTEITAANAAALVSKLLQFTSGGIYDTEKQWHRVHDLKLEALRKVFKQAGGPVLVAVGFRHEMQRIREAFPQARFFDDAKTATAQKDLLLDWNAGKIPMLVAHPKSIGHGLNMQGNPGVKCNTIVWFTLTYSREDYEQMIARLARRGQEDITYVYRLMCPDTVDYAVATVIEEKRATEDRLLTALQLLESYREKGTKPMKLITRTQEDWV